MIYGKAVPVKLCEPKDGLEVTGDPLGKDNKPSCWLGDSKTSPITRKNVNDVLDDKH